MRIAVRLTFLLLLLSLTSRAQLTVQGRVYGGSNQEPLPFANVFLSGTTKGTVTDETGAFKLTDVPSGKFDLIVSFVGFTTLKTTVQTGDPKTYRFVLRPLENQLNAVTVNARRPRGPDWDRQIALFIENFIGTSQNATQCKLLNEEVLSFSQRGDTLTARAQEPLLIDNQALGYRLKFQLDKFVYDYAQYRVTYEGNPVFELLTPRNSREAKRWHDNRQRAYFGSTMHFGRALYRRELAREGFAFQRVIERRNQRGELTMVGLPGDTTIEARSLANRKKLIPLPMANYNIILDSIRSTPLVPVVLFTDLIQVTYTREQEPFAFQRARRPTTVGNPALFQRSLLRMLEPDLTLEPNGQFWPARGFRSEGYWAWELVADDLPWDYDPDEPLDNQ